MPGTSMRCELVRVGILSLVCSCPQHPGQSLDAKCMKGMTAPEGVEKNLLVDGRWMDDGEVITEE